MENTVKVALVVQHSCLMLHRNVEQIVKAIGWDEYKKPGVKEVIQRVPSKAGMLMGEVAHRVSWTDKTNDRGRRLFLYEQLSLPKEQIEAMLAELKAKPLTPGS